MTSFRTAARTRMRKAVVPLLLVVGFVNSGTALACSCVRTSGPTSIQVANAVRQSTAVFAAQVVEVEDFMAGSEQYQAAKLKVLRSWKGPHAVGAVVATESPSQCCLCGIKVTLGQTLLVYISGKQPYRLSDCSRTQSLGAAADDIKILDSSKPETAKR